MKFIVELRIEDTDRIPLSIALETIDRPCDVVEDVGLRLEEAKAILGRLQEEVVRNQLARHLEAQRSCRSCDQPHPIKGYHPMRFRTAFGDISLRSPRWHACGCEGKPVKAAFSPLNAILTTHTAPELDFLQSKWAAHLSFAAVADLLHDVLPVDRGLHADTVRQHVFATAERLEAELGPEQFAYDAGCQRDIEASPEPGPPVTVGLDGGYIRGRERVPGATNCFEVLAGKCIPQEGDAKVFALVRRIDQKPKRRLHEVLQAQGVVPRQQPTFLSDGGDNVRQLPAFLHPNSEHILDWFHVAMRIEQLSQTARGVREESAGITKEEILHQLERVKWFLWHGNVTEAAETLSELIDGVDGARAEDKEADLPAHVVLKKLARALDEFDTYIVGNADAIVNYGERYRCGERISTGFVESTINQVIAKRFVKKQQMRWTERGAHLLLQVRVNVLNEDLHKAFQRWHPGLDRSSQEKLAA